MNQSKLDDTIEEIVDNFLEGRVENPEQLPYEIEHIGRAEGNRIVADAFIMFDSDSHIFGMQELMDELFENLSLIPDGEQDDYFSLCGSEKVNTIGFTVEVNE